MKRDFGSNFDWQSASGKGRLRAYINLKLASLGLPVYSKEGTAFLELANDMLANFREKERMMPDYLPPVDSRIQAYLDAYLAELDPADRPRLPSKTLVLDRFGMAREISLPPDAHEYNSPALSSYRIRNGILHNPANDKRTTQGVFHIAEGGLPVPLDKKAVPKIAFARLLKRAFQVPEDMLTLPFTAQEAKQARVFLSLYLRPIVRPEVPWMFEEMAMETRFFAPASLAANLDFVESIFGNSGDPYIPTNDAALDPMHWTGHTGCIILATHLVSCSKKELGLPSWDKATERQRADGMAYKDEAELYNNGKPFKICARDERGVIITIIADNYFGYSKKEIKTQISYSSNLLGLTEEEHAGGAIVIPSYNLGTRFVPDTNLHSKGQSFKNLTRLLGDRIEIQEKGYAIDCMYPKIVYIPEDAVLSLDSQSALWIKEGQKQELRILPDELYIHPSGYQIRMDQHPKTGSWRLIGTQAEGLLFHKPCTVSGGGKSEISKSISDAMSDGPIVTGDFQADMDAVQLLIDHDYSKRFKNTESNRKSGSRSILSEQRSLGSVIKLLSPSPLYSDEYNKWLETIPQRIKALVFLVKRFYRPEWGKDWLSHFGTDVVNGAAGNVIKFEGRPIQASYLRIGLTPEGQRSVHKLRQDYMPAQKIQWEDDITASIIVPLKSLSGLPDTHNMHSLKFVKNCEARFFQRPDDAIHRGYDKQAEADLARKDNFVSNFEALSRSKAMALMEKAVDLSEYSEPMKRMIVEAEKDDNYQYFVLSSQPRIVDGKASQNPRYLQLDPVYKNPFHHYVCDVSARLFRMLESDKPVYHPVGAVLPGRRNNPPDLKAGIRALAVYGPVHYQELPELFMDFVCSLTGKSPSTTGAGSEGALTKGPFNALSPTTDLNNALLGFILSGYDGFSTAAGYIGHKYRFDHDLSLLIPELWARLSPEERSFAFLSRNGYLEKLNDFEYRGKLIPAARLGWRITPLFASTFLGRIFDAPSQVFPEEVLKPELQSMEHFADGIMNIAEAQEKVAKDYIKDGSIEAAIPPLKAILHIMAEGSWEGGGLDKPKLRMLFSRDYVLSSDWYKERLKAYASQEKARLDKGIFALEKFLTDTSGKSEAELLRAKRKLEQCKNKAHSMKLANCITELEGTIGLDPLYHRKD